MDNVLALEEDVTEDSDSKVGVVLDTTEASGAAGRSIVDVLARHRLKDATNGDGEAGKGGTAREQVSALCAVELGASDLSPVGLGDRSVDVDQCCAGVDDAVDAAADGGRSADLVAGSSKPPEALAAVDRHVGDGASVLGGVNEAEIEGTGGVVLEVDGEELLSKGALDGVEEGVLGRRRNGVDGAESETEKTVGVLVLRELGGDGSGSLDSLGGGSHTTNGDLVSIDLARGTRAITVADLP